MYDIVLTLDLACKLHADGVVKTSTSVARVFARNDPINPTKRIVWDLTDNWLYYMHTQYEYMIEIPEQLINELVVITDAKARITFFNILLQSGEISETV